jgi:hypothetical protein
MRLSITIGTVKGTVIRLHITMICASLNRLFLIVRLLMTDSRIN